MNTQRERQQDEFLQDVRLRRGSGAGADGEDVEVGGGFEWGAEFGPPGEGGPDFERGGGGGIVSNEGGGGEEVVMVGGWG